MNHYEICFKGWCGEPGKRKHRLTNYCKEGYPTDSKTDLRFSSEGLNNERCVDWYGRCSELKPCKKSGGWEPKVRWEPKRGKMI